MHQSSVLRSLLNRLPKHPQQMRLLQGLGMLLACLFSIGLGFQIGSSRGDAPLPLSSAASSLGNAPVAGPRATLSAGMAMSPGTSATGLRADAPSSSFVSADQSVSSLSSSQSAAPHKSVSESLSAAGAVGPSGVRGASSVSDGASVAASSFESIPEEPLAPKVQVPLIYKNVNPAAVGLSTSQVASINQMRSDFNAQVGQQQNPAAPQYAQSWASAQVAMDEKLRVLLGWQQFNLYQINAAKSR